MIKEVKNWIDNGCNYNEGLMLFSRLSKNQKLIAFLNGDPRFKDRPVKLKYELMKLADIKQTLDVPKKAKPVSQATKPKPVQKVHKEETKIKIVSPEVFKVISEAIKPENVYKSGTVYPEFVQDAVNLYSSLYKAKAVLYDERAKLGWDNSPELVLKRKEMSDEIIDLSSKMEILFKVKDDYEKLGIVPTENIALSLMANTQEELPNSVDELKKLKKNLQTNNSKDRNLLDYQSKAAKQRKSPMPAGYKRTKIEERIKLRTIEISKVDEKLKLLGNE